MSSELSPESQAFLNNLLAGERELIRVDLQSMGSFGEMIGDLVLLKLTDILTAGLKRHENGELASQIDHQSVLAELGLSSLPQNNFNSQINNNLPELADTGTDYTTPLQPQDYANLDGLPQVVKHEKCDCSECVNELKIEVKEEVDDDVQLIEQSCPPTKTPPMVSTQPPSRQQSRTTRKSARRGKK